MEKKINIIRGLCVPLLVVFVGVGAFCLLFSYIYSEALEVSSCDLCFELNPGLAGCEFYEPLPPINFSNLNITNPPASYGS